ncbi:MAG TPA: helix-turn-helix domain-containing protein [Paenibacillus sp.]|nr:helix-turn-helix domain-containing protein [Paenibacillus sp.]
MNPKTHAFRMALFWRLFLNYFALILIPVIVAGILVFFYFARLIEKDAETLNAVVMSHFSEQTDASFHALQTDIIDMLSTSNLSGLLRETDASPENRRRSELIHTLREQLINLQSGELASKAFLYFADQDLVIDADTYTDKDYYFRFRYPLNPQEQAAFLSQMTGKKMMQVSDPYASHLSVLMSYPFNTNDPDVYLVVNVHQDRLQRRMDIPEKWVTGTALADNDGRVISQSGLTESETRWLQERVRSQTKPSLFLISDGKALSLSRSQYNEAWYYVSIADLRTLMKPVYTARLVAWAFLVFFLSVGGLVSSYFSKRLCEPILEIKEGLKLHRASHAPPSDEGDDFDAIKRVSRLIVTENKHLSQMVDDMTPIVQEHFVTKMLLGEYRDALSIEIYAKEIDFPYHKKAIRTALAVALHYESSADERLSETSKSFLMAELKERIRKSSPSAVWLCQTKPGVLACVVHHDPFLRFGPNDAAELIAIVLRQYGGYFKATIGIGKTVHAVEELHVSYEHAASVLKHRGLDEDVEICSDRSAPDGPPWDNFLSVQDINRMMNQYKSKEYDKLLQSALELLEEGRRRSAGASQVKQVCTDVLNAWIRAVGTEHQDVNVPFYSGLYDRLNRCMTWDDVRRCMKSVHALLFPTSEAGDRSKQFSDILDYIDAHYNQELSIEYFADAMNMSVGHFSRTFKEEVGEKYVEYIAKCRMRKAKQFLLESNMTIDDIAEAVGYWGRNSFIRTFRKYEGITPAKYRSAYR